MARQPSIFEDVNPSPDVATMVRAGDPFTSVDAAAVVVKVRTELQAQVLEAFQSRGHMTDDQVATLQEFRHLAPSTVRSRRAELVERGDLRMVGESRNTRGRKVLVWGATRD